jgi:hypothetical protein
MNTMNEVITPTASCFEIGGTGSKSSALRVFSATKRSMLISRRARGGCLTRIECRIGAHEVDWDSLNHWKRLELVKGQEDRKVLVIPVM